MDIRCRKTTCAHNDRFTCKAKEILIGSKVVCQTFESDPNKKPQTPAKSCLKKRLSLPRSAIAKPFAFFAKQIVFSITMASAFQME